MRIGNDLDGCYDSFSTGVYNTMVAKGIEHLWKSGPTPYSYWDWYKDWNWTFEQFKELVDWGVDNRYIFSGNWRPNALKSFARLNELRREGHQIILVTDRSFGSNPMNSQRNTLEGLERAGIKYDEIHFTADKTSVQLDTMVEDKLANYDALVEDGTPTWLINRSWNHAPEGDGRNRISCVSEYVDAVEAVAKQGYADLVLA